MKLSTKLNIRRFSLLLFFLGPLGLNILNKNKVLDENYLLGKMCMLPFELSFFADGYTTRITKDYKELKETYDKILNRTKTLLDDLEIIDSVSIFSLFVYLYRTGAMSYEHNFVYDTNMKDFPDLFGADVIRGTGVCRSIAFLLRDLYRKMGYESYCLVVNANDNAIKSLKGNAKVSLKTSGNGKSFARIVSWLTTLTRVPNHVITIVKKEGKSYVFDATNDGILNTGNLKRIKLLNDDGKYMNNSFLISFLENALGLFSNVKDFIMANKLLLGKSITIEEYDALYHDTLKIIDDNETLINKYYDDNEKDYKTLHDNLSNYKGLAGRMIPLSVKKIKKRK